jgi:GTPase
MHSLTQRAISLSYCRTRVMQNPPARAHSNSSNSLNVYPYRSLSNTLIKEVRLEMHRAIHGGSLDTVPRSQPRNGSSQRQRTSLLVRAHAKNKRNIEISSPSPPRSATFKDAGQSAFADLDDDASTSAPDYSDYMEFQEDPPGHKAGFVAIIGKPNAGKSTLLNRLIGQQLSVVTAKAQTTRHRIVGIWSGSGHQAVFLDTPGIIDRRRDELENRMMGAVDEALRDADAVLAVVDSSHRPKDVLQMLHPGSDWKGPPMAFVLNKMDVLSEEEAEALVSWFGSQARAAAVLPISALEGDGVDAVAQWVIERLPEGPSMYPKDVIAEASERFFVSEIIRRQVFLQYREELPYQVAVQVAEFKERKPPAKTLIRAHVIVEKDRHKGILLGARGAAIKGLSTASRLEIEEFLGNGVYLELSVKVLEGWRRDPKQLERLGY